MRITVLNAFIILYFSVSAYGQELGVPGNLKAEINEDGTNIHLVWDKPEGKVAGYNLFVKSGSQEDFLLWGSAGLIFDRKYDFEVMSKYGKFYEFKVCAVQNFPSVIRSELSASIMIEVPSRYLPIVKLNNPTTKRGIVEISWEYETIVSDLQGFILYLDGKEIKVTKAKRKFVFDNLSAGKHNVQLLAYSNSGLKSVMSVKKFIRIK